METAIDEPPSYLLADVLGSPATFFLINGLILFVLLILSALISGSEVAFFSLTSKDLDQCRVSEDKSEKNLLSLIAKPKLLLATILILNNFVNVAIVTVSTFMMWKAVGSKSTEGFLISLLTIAVTLAIVFFGEVIPKVYATQNNLSFAKTTAPALKLAESFFKPLSYILMGLSRIVEKRFEKKGYSVSVDELNQALEITTTNEDTTEEEKGILKGIVNFSTLSVKQVMRSRMDITAFDVEMDFHELMNKVNKSGFSRIPAYKETVDSIQGILYVKDLLPSVNKDEHFQWQDLLRPGFFVPESKKIDSLLKDFQEKRVHMAIVVDEYGGTSGLITLEDIIEEIIGEINDEFDEEDIAFNKLDEATYIFEGKTSLNDFCKVINEEANIFDEIKGESESLGGLLLELHAKMPRAGEVIKFDRFVFTVVAVDNRRIKRIRILINEVKP